jgi:ketosteroid isomerase-like protein
MSRNLDLLQAAYQRAGRDDVDATPGPWDCHDREQVLETFRCQYDHGVRANFGEPIEAGDKVILDVRPYRQDEHGNKTGDRLWQVLTMRDGKIIRIQDSTDQATALQAAGLPTGP